MERSFEVQLGISVLPTSFMRELPGRVANCRRIKRVQMKAKKEVFLLKKSPNRKYLRAHGCRRACGGHTHLSDQSSVLYEKL